MDKRIVYTLLGICVFFSMLGGCNSCVNSKKIKKEQAETKVFMLKNFSTREETALLAKKQGLMDERRTVLNINQIFLTKKRPDQRVIEIEGEMEELGKRQELFDKNIDEYVKHIRSEFEK